jgi:hypothetical protein
VTNDRQSDQLPDRAVSIRCEQDITIWYDPTTDCVLVRRRQHGRYVVAYFPWSLLEQIRQEMRLKVA